VVNVGGTHGTLFSWEITDMFKITPSNHITQILVRSCLWDITQKDRPLGRLESIVVPYHSGIGGLEWSRSVPNLHWVECGWVVVFGHIG
jgi:hypothetical protein